MAYIIETLDDIAQELGISVSTARRWIRDHGFPASKRPNGNWITTRTLIDQWILARAEVQNKNFPKPE